MRSADSTAVGPEETEGEELHTLQLDGTDQGIQLTDEEFDALLTYDKELENQAVSTHPPVSVCMSRTVPAEIELRRTRKGKLQSIQKISVH